MSIAQSLLPEFDHEMATTRKVLAAVPEGKNDWKPHPKSMTLGRLAGHVAELPPDFMVPWTLKAAGHTIFTMPRIAVVKSFMLNHTIHHRAQLGVYLRLNDVAVPGCYGPSADEK